MKTNCEKIPNGVVDINNFLLKIWDYLKKEQRYVIKEISEYIPYLLSISECIYFDINVNSRSTISKEKRKEIFEYFIKKNPSYFSKSQIKTIETQF